MSKRAPSRRAAPRPPRPPATGGPPLQVYAAAALVLLTLLAYANAFGGDFVLDSKVIILEDPRLREVSGANLELILNRSYWWPYRTADNLYRPATTLSYLFNYSLLGNGTHPVGYHVINVLLHAANVLLAYLIAWRLSGHVIAAGALAAVWAVHPLATEAVTNIVGRADLLASFGVLAALYAYLRASDSAGRLRTRWMAIAIAAATLGVFSKESAVATPAVIILFDVLLRRPRRPWSTLWPGWLAMSVPVGVLLIARALVLEPLPPGSTLPVDNPIVIAGFWQGLLTALAVLPRYVWLTLWPVRLSADYSYAQIPLASGTFVEWMGWLSLIAIVTVCVIAGRRRPMVAFASASALVVILPASNLLFATGTIMGERLAYLPMLGILGCLAVGVAFVLERFGVQTRVGLSVVGVIVGALTAGTWARNADWATSVSIWQAAAEASPNSFKAHQGYADALYESDPDRTRLAEIVRHSHRSAEIVSSLPDHQSVIRVYRLAAVYALEYGDQLQSRGGEASDAEARTFFDTGVRYAQRHVEVLTAVRGGEAAVLANPDNVRELAEAYRLLSTVQSRMGTGTEALATAERARALEPLSPDSYRTMAVAQFAASRYDDAAATFITGFMVTGDPSLRNSVIELYQAGLDRAGCATTAGPSGPTLNPACEPVRRHLCLASREAVATQRSRGRDDLADNLQTSALESFGCPASFFPASR